MVIWVESLIQYHSSVENSKTNLSLIMNMAWVLNLSFHHDIVRCMSCILIQRKGTIRIRRIFIFPKVTTWLAITFSATCNKTSSDVESIFDESAFWNLNPLWIQVTACDRLCELVQIRCLKYRWNLMILVSRFSWNWRSWES